MWIDYRIMPTKNISRKISTPCAVNPAITNVP